MFVGKVLSSFGIVVVLPDYRNFPQGVINDMLDDVDESLSWVFRNIEHFGGDKESIFLMGQSAGAHLSLLTLLRKARREHEEMKRTGKNLPECSEKGMGWDCTKISGYLGVAGPYNVYDLQEDFTGRGLPPKLLEAIMGGKEFIKRHSVDYILENESEYKEVKLIERIPPLFLLHGTADLVVPCQATLDTAARLARAGVETHIKFYPGKSHTDAIIEDLVYADDLCEEDLMTDIATIVLAKKNLRVAASQVTHRIKLAQDQKDASQAPSLIERTTSDEAPEYRHRPSFMAPTLEKPQDFDLKSIRRSVIPKFAWALARIVNPF